MGKEYCKAQSKFGLSSHIIEKQWTETEDNQVYKLNLQILNWQIVDIKLQWIKITINLLPFAQFKALKLNQIIILLEPEKPFFLKKKRTSNSELDSSFVCLHALIINTMNNPRGQLWIDNNANRFINCQAWYYIV